MNELFPIPRATRASAGLARLRELPALAFFGHGFTYAFGACLLGVLSAGTMLIAPRLLDPAAFGVFALLTSLFHYACRSDLGLSQLADRQIALDGGDSAHRGDRIMRLLWRIAGVILLVFVPLSMLTAAAVGFPVVVTGLALAGGTFAMVGNGPATIHRAASRVWEFTVTSLVLQVGLTLPRLVGLVLAGVSGSFVGLLAWYAAMALVFAPPGRNVVAQRGPPLLPMLRTALPLFAFNGLWLLYLTANRWVSSALSTPLDAGLFAFGASLSLVGLGMLGAVAQVRYPRLLTRMREADPVTSSDILEREMLWVGLGLTGIALIAGLAAPQLIALLFPDYEGAAQSTVALAVSCIPLGVMAWTMPMAIVLSHRPGRDAVRLLLPGLVIVVAAMLAGDRLLGIAGQAWACVVGALLLLSTYTNLLRRYGTLTTRASLRIVIGHFAAVAALAALAYALAPAPAKAAPPPGWKLVFEDEFRTLQLWDEGHGVWEPHYPWGSRTNEANLEEQYYIDPRPGRDAAEIMALEPFRVEDGILSIRADVVPESLREKADGHPYAAGLLTTFRSHGFTYGYFEMRARLPAGRGLWPAFWLLPVEIAWPPEIDVMEVLGHDTRSLHVTLHTGQGEDQTKQGRTVPTPDMSEDFHVFGVAWTATEVTWFFDGKEVFSAPTPDDMHQPKYLLVNLAVGGEWPGSPDETTKFPASFEIDWIRVWQPDEIPHDGKGRR